MSQASVEVVKEFFIIHSFFVLNKEDILFVKKTGIDEPEETGKFILSGNQVSRVLNNAVIKPICWHTMTITPAVLSRSLDIFEFFKGKDAPDNKKFFQGENFKKVFIIPSLPVTENLYKKSIGIMKENGIDHIIFFSSVLASLIDKIDERNVYLSSVNEIFRVLKFYKLFTDKEQELPF